jgi:hypothetical protein
VLTINTEQIESCALQSARSSLKAEQASGRMRVHACLMLVPPLLWQIITHLHMGTHKRPVCRCGLRGRRQLH